MVDSTRDFGSQQFTFISRPAFRSLDFKFSIRTVEPAELAETAQPRNDRQIFVFTLLSQT